MADPCGSAHDRIMIDVDRGPLSTAHDAAVSARSGRVVVDPDPARIGEDQMDDVINGVAERLIEQFGDPPEGGA